MANFLFVSSLIIITFEFISVFSILTEELFFIDNLYLLLFFILFFWKFFVDIKIEKFNFNLDIITKHYYYFAKTPNFFVNYLFIILKQIYIFYVFFKYRFTIDTNKMILKFHLKKIPLLWKPLFKKFSYFGYYRSNRSKWLK